MSNIGFVDNIVKKACKSAFNFGHDTLTNLLNKTKKIDVRTKRNDVLKKANENV